MMAALYARVSKGEEQSPENQVRQLREWAKNHPDHPTVVGVFVDRGSSRDTRPNKERVLELIERGAVDTVVFVSIDRWGRDLAELVHELRELPQRGVSLISLREGLNFNDAAGKMYANLLAVFADFERERIRERTIWGLERVSSQGRKLGRHPKGCRCKRHRAASPTRGPHPEGCACGRHRLERLREWKERQERLRGLQGGISAGGH